jgi:hypothetical protein
MLKKVGILMAVVILALPAVALAQFEAGDREFTISGSGSSDNDLDNNFISFQGSFGKFFSQALEGIIRQELSFADTEAGGSWAASTSLGADYHFNLGKIIPLIGASLGVVYGDDVDETMFAAPEVGIKGFVNNTTFVQGLVQYQWFFDSSNEVDNNFDDGRFVYVLGLGVRF